MKIADEFPDRDDRRLWYQRGYQSARRSEWPGFSYPVPPEPLTKQLAQAATAMVQAIENELCTFDDSAEMVVRLKAPIDRVVQAVMALSSAAVTP